MPAQPTRRAAVVAPSVVQDSGPQIRLDEAIASARADAVAERLEDVRMTRARITAARTALDDAVDANAAALRAAWAAGATVRQLADVGQLGKTRTHELVRDTPRAA